MTFYHFGNCLALAYVPYYLTYKYSGLSEYGAFWKCVTAGVLYMVTQLVKMLFLATFFPMSTSELDDGFYDDDAEVPFVFFTEFLKVTVDLADLFGLHLVMQRVAGKGQTKVLVAGLGWSFAELVLTRVIALWVGARGVEFDWKFIQKSFDANISLVHFLTLSCLVWLSTLRKVEANRAALLPILVALILAVSYKTLFLESLAQMLELGSWTALIYKALTTLGLGLVTLQVYVGVAGTSDRY